MYVYLAQTQVYIFALFEVCSFVNFIALFYLVKTCIQSAVIYPTVQIHHTSHCPRAVTKENGRIPRPLPSLPLSFSSPRQFQFPPLSLCSSQQIRRRPRGGPHGDPPPPSEGARRPLGTPAWQRAVSLAEADLDEGTHRR
jgi:hypothetical protein